MPQHPESPAARSDSSLPAPHLHRPDALQHFRRLLSEAGFTEEGVCRRLGLDSIYDFRTLRGGRQGADEAAPGASSTELDGLGLLIHLFMDGEPMGRGRLEEGLGTEAVTAMEELRLLATHPAEREGLAALALVYPVAGLHIASDLNDDAPGASPDGGRLRADAVYPALAGAVRGFLDDLPRTPCSRVLDLCAGTGVAALLSAPLAQEVWALDITERATHFARFNALLNGVNTLEARTGDLYDPLEGRRFDRIVAHPPYLPTVDPDLVFRDGGSDGEGVFRRIVEGLPHHLDSGGLFYGHGMATDRRERPLETRLRGMLGPRHGEFDVYLAVSRTLTPQEFVLGRLRSGRATVDEAARHLEILDQLQVERFVRGSVLVERRSQVGSRRGDQAPITARRRRGRSGGWPDLEVLRGRERSAARAARDGKVSELRLRLTPGIGLSTRYTVTEEGLAGQGVELTTDAPFHGTVRLPMEAGRLLPLFDGRRTVRQVRGKAIQEGILPRDTPPGEFHGVVESLLRGGFLHLEGDDKES